MPLIPQVVLHDPSPVRLPDAASLQTALAGLNPATVDAELMTALAGAFPGFDFSLAELDDEYWRDTCSVIQPDETRIGELQPWMTAELAKDGGDVKATWGRLKDTNLEITEWRGSSAFVFAPIGPAAADYIQVALGREVEGRAGPIVNPDYRPWSKQELLDPSWPRRDPLPETDRLAGPVYRLLGRAGGAFVHVRSFLDSCGRIEREAPFLGLAPDDFEFVPRELRFFQDWEASSARSRRVFAYWALDARHYVHQDDREIALPFGWFFLMTHGHWVDPEVGYAIAGGLKAQRIRLPDPVARVLLRWADRSYGF